MIFEATGAASSLMDSSLCAIPGIIVDIRVLQCWFSLLTSLNINMWGAMQRCCVDLLIPVLGPWFDTRILSPRNALHMKYTDSKWLDQWKGEFIIDFHCAAVCAKEGSNMTCRGALDLGPPGRAHSMVSPECQSRQAPYILYRSHCRKAGSGPALGLHSAQPPG